MIQVNYYFIIILNMHLFSFANEEDKEIEINKCKNFNIQDKS